MITKLTSEQEAQLTTFYEECLQTGLSTEPVDFKKIEELISDFYIRINNPKPIFWHCPSPFMIQIWYNLINPGNRGNNLNDNIRYNLRNNLEDNLKDNLEDNIRNKLRNNLEDNLRNNLRNNLEDNLKDNIRNNLEDNLRNNLEDNLRNNLRNKLRNNLEDNLKDNIRNNLEDNLWNKLRNNLRNNLEDNLWNKLEDNLWNKLEDNLRNNLRNKLEDNLKNNLWKNRFQFYYNYMWGQLDISWLSLYLYPELYLNIKYDKADSILLHNWYELSKSSFWWYPFKNICFISDRPNIIKKKDIQLHCDTGPALSFRDNYELFFLNGVNVPKEYVTTSAHNLDPELIIKETNAEVRRELVRKIGIEKVISKLGGKIIDKWNGYELLELDIPDMNIKPVYLNMKNPSLENTHHLEGVPPEIQTCQEALKWRTGGIEWNPEQLT